MNNSYNAFRNITNFRNTGKSQPISGIELMVDEKNMYFAGNDNGYVMTIDCPYGTQEMANDLLAKAKGFEYQGFAAEQVILPPETELGDGVTVAGIYGMVARRSFKFTPGMTSNIEAPRELEVQHEYKYSSPQQRKTERQIAQTRTLITKTAEEIILKVESLDGKYTEVKTTLDGLTVTDQSGTTKIKGSSIETSTLYVDAANISGKLTANQIQASSISVGDLKDGSSYATKTYVDSNAGLSANEVDNAIATYIDSTSITAQKLRGQTVELLANSNTAVGSLEIAYTTTGIGLGIKTTYGGIQIQAAGNLFLSAGTGGAITLQNNRIVLAGALCLGGSSYGPSAPSGTGAAGQLYVQLVS